MNSDLNLYWDTESGEAVVAGSKYPGQILITRLTDNNWNIDSLATDEQLSELAADLVRNDCFVVTEGANERVLSDAESIAAMLLALQYIRSVAQNEEDY